jgi:hypothetical protein
VYSQRKVVKLVLHARQFRSFIPGISSKTDTCSQVLHDPVTLRSNIFGFRLRKTVQIQRGSHQEKAGNSADLRKKYALAPLHVTIRFLLYCSENSCGIRLKRARPSVYGAVSCCGRTTRETTCDAIAKATKLHNGLGGFIFAYLSRMMGDGNTNSTKSRLSPAGRRSQTQSSVQDHSLV